MSDFQDIFDANKELSEDEVVMLIYDAAEDMSLKECQSEYRSLATAAGLIKTPQQRKVEWEDAIEAAEVDISTPEGVTTAKAIGNDLDIGSQTITRYLKALAAETGVELAVTTSVRAPGKWKEIVEAFTEDEVMNSPRADVVAKINEVGEYDDLKKAGNYYSRLRREFGWVPPESMSSQLNNWYSENLTASKQEIMDKASEIGMSEASAQYYVGVYKIVFELLEKMELIEEAA